MIHEVHDTEADTKYTAAVCDLCRAECEASRQPGRFTTTTAEKAREVALLHQGWSRRLEPNLNKRGRRKGWVVQLLCPKCTAPPAPDAPERST